MIAGLVLLTGAICPVARSASSMQDELRVGGGTVRVTLLRGGETLELATSVKR